MKKYFVLVNILQSESKDLLRLQTPTCGDDHVLPLDHIGVSLVELADALAWQTTVVKLQDVPDFYRHCADLLNPHVVLRLHRAVTPAHIHPVHNSGNG